MVEDCDHFYIWQFDTSPTQGWGKVRARLGQAQGWGTVGARSGQKARFGQGRGKLAAIPMYFTLITPPSLSPASITYQSHYHYLLPQPCPNLACPDLAPTFPQPCVGEVSSCLIFLSYFDSLPTRKCLVVVNTERLILMKFERTYRLICSERY